MVKWIQYDTLMLRDMHAHIMDTNLSVPLPLAACGSSGALQLHTSIRPGDICHMHMARLLLGGPPGVAKVKCARAINAVCHW